MLIVMICRPNDSEFQRLHDEFAGALHSLHPVSPDAVLTDIFAGLEPDAVVLDLSRDILGAESTAALIVEAHRDRFVPVVGLLAAEDVQQFDLSSGLDDFLVRPFTTHELIARVGQSQWRRRQTIGDDAIRLGDLVVDLNRYEVWVAGREVTLTFKEYELLRLLASNPGRVFTREVLLNRIWSYDYFGGTRTVDVHIRRLRAKVEDPTHSFVETVRNVGYRFRAD